MTDYDHDNFLLNSKTLRITLYLSLVIGHLVFGVLYPESITIAATGFAFFAALVLFYLRPYEQQHQPVKIDKTVRFDK